MTDRHDIDADDLPAEEGDSGEDARDRLHQAPDAQANFTETHPDEARRDQRLMREGGTTDAELDARGDGSPDR